ncbi:DUF4376 domain-containing protein [Pseudomonas sp. SLFW]|uniref:DUF4376 domain-containing protein n=1 Tax=Pseudomonas sp. SLFW TaxID=2683259 RepID=UPI0014130D15|nr:DUF4376 domain-containing protein [Pseudomonas sp. SLFW]NBB11831.1 DUF4376 domain-containing protein [Pseudomonas sp. SLFW]
MIFYQWDASGLFVGQQDVDEEGALPPRSTPTKPPKLTGTQVARWTGEGWEKLAKAPDPDPEPAPDWVALIADRRFRAEIAGFPWNGFGIDTERDSQAKISSSWSAARDGFREDGSVWKCLDLATGQIVSRPTTNAEMIDIGQQAYRYVQACYDREGALLEAAAGGTVTAEMIEEGWPT